MIGLVRLVAEDFGTTLGMAVLYTLAAAILWIGRRPRGLRSFPVRYLVVGGALFVVTDVCVGLAVGLAADANQAIEVSIVNYLWPTGTVLLAALVQRRRRRSWLLLGGAVVATTGMAYAVGGDAGLAPAIIASNVAANPAPYTLALTAAIAWSCYSVLSPGLSRGRDGITLFFTGVAGSLWAVHLLTGAPAPDDVPWTGFLALLAAAAVLAAGYAFWNVGILNGDMRVLSTASYTTPVLSSAVGALLLGTSLALPFWCGVALVVVGSLLSWGAGRDGTATTAPSATAGRIGRPTPGSRSDAARQV